ncbi:MAP kinase kinase kinase [Brachionus plicatilis]|uniref:non-specific serine/threonine protein kinase n=1 Tax=Brachionus plicatilis TaxID=10195 RepID=A0A3M7QDR0_BRAPC|nr:MAP kinase kinase kinase [Brachionus plicatilis]
MHQTKDWSEEYTKVNRHSIGQGTFGKVYLVRSNSDKKLYALKEINLNQYILRISVINRSYALEEGFKLNILKIDHDNIIKYFNSYIHKDHVYWIMEYCDGGTLREQISLYRKQVRIMDENLIWYWCIQILTGIEYLHKCGIIHRDLKPENIYIHNKRGTCKIGDFGFAKLVVESSITENRVIKYTNDSNESDADCYLSKNDKQEEKIIYNLVNISQVGTPYYMAPELRMLIDSHIAYASLDTINKRIKICEKFIYKGDVFSFGCIIYELAFLKKAFAVKDKFKITDVCIEKVRINLETNVTYSDDLKNLIRSCLIVEPCERPAVKQLMSKNFLVSRLDIDYSEYFKKQVIPSPSIDPRFNSVYFMDFKLTGYYKPMTMKSLKYNQNMIVILVFKTHNLDESKLLLYNEYGQLVKELDSYLPSKNASAHSNFNFGIYDFCVDEDNNHLYLSTKKFGIVRFKIVETSHYLEEIILDGYLDLNEINDQENSIFPTCLNLIEDESAFRETMKTSGKRRLIFYDRSSKRIISLQVDLKSQADTDRIKCYINAGLTLEQQYIRQMVNSSSELICLFDDLPSLNVYDLKTLLPKRSNRNKGAKNNFRCLTLDSHGFLYSTDGKSIFNIDSNFNELNRLNFCFGSERKFAHTFSWMSFLTNSKIVLLTDALQMEKSTILILLPC